MPVFAEKRYGDDHEKPNHQYELNEHNLVKAAVKKIDPNNDGAANHQLQPTRIGDPS